MSRRAHKRWTWVDLLSFGSPPQLVILGSIAALTATFFALFTWGK